MWRLPKRQREILSVRSIRFHTWEHGASRSHNPLNGGLIVHRQWKSHFNKNPYKLAAASEPIFSLHYNVVRVSSQPFQSKRIITFHSCVFIFCCFTHSKEKSIICLKLFIARLSALSVLRWKIDIRIAHFFRLEKNYVLFGIFGSEAFFVFFSSNQRTNLPHLIFMWGISSDL